jgi:hypothetical protein
MHNNNNTFDTKTLAIMIIAITLFTSWFFLLFAIPLAYFIYKQKKVALILSQVYLPIIFIITFSTFTESMRSTDGNISTDATGSVATFFLFAFAFYFYLARRSWKVYKV